MKWRWIKKIYKVVYENHGYKRNKQLRNKKYKKF